jgi:AraC family transcriptional regulator
VAPHKYLSNLRVEEAKRVMLTTKLPLADTALIRGFGDQSYFTRVFSRQTGHAAQEQLRWIIGAFLTRA